MEDPGKKNTETYTRSLSYATAGVDPKKGTISLATKGPKGKWINAVEKNDGGSKKFVKGPWKEGYPLGTYGVDQRTRTAWAVINYTGDFAATIGE